MQSLRFQAKHFQMILRYVLNVRFNHTYRPEVEKIFKQESRAHHEFYLLYNYIYLNFVSIYYNFNNTYLDIRLFC